MACSPYIIIITQTVLLYIPASLCQCESSTLFGFMATWAPNEPFITVIVVCTLTYSLVLLTETLRKMDDGEAELRKILCLY